MQNQITQPAKICKDRWPRGYFPVLWCPHVSAALQVLLQAALESDNRCGQTVETCGTWKIFKDCLGCCRSLHVLKISTFLCFLKTRLEESACMLSLLFKWADSLTDLSQQKWQVQLPFHGWLHVLDLGLDANHLALCHLAPGPRFALMLAVCWKKWYIMVHHGISSRNYEGPKISNVNSHIFDVIRWFGCTANIIQEPKCIKM